jgi:hypothetical protein
MVVNIVDASCGKGKTTSVINKINEDAENHKYLYITPLLSEVERIIRECPNKQFKQPEEDKTTKLLSGEHGMKFSGKPIIEVDITGASRSRYQNGASAKNPFEMYEGQRRYMNPVIFHWVLSWNFKLIILNNSSYPAYNLQIENIGQVQLDEFKNLPRKNNLSPHNSIEIDLVYTENIECDAKSADSILKPRFPEKFADLVLRINCVDEQRSTNFSTLVQFEEGEIINQWIL